MLFHLADAIIDVDVERTRAFYARPDVLTTSQGCSCTGCQNFDKAILTVPDTVTAFLASLGIDPRKPAETYCVKGVGEREADGTVEKWPDFEQTETRITIRPEDYYRPDPAFHYEVIIEPMVDLIHKEMPRPVIQLMFDTYLPYVLKEQ